MGYAFSTRVSPLWTMARRRFGLIVKKTLDDGTDSLKTFGAYLVWILYPSLCLVSPAMTVKSRPAMARIVPPFSVYGLNLRSCIGRRVCVWTVRYGGERFRVAVHGSGLSPAKLTKERRRV